MRGIFDQPLLDLIAQAQQLHSSTTAAGSAALPADIDQDRRLPRRLCLLSAERHYETDVENEGLLGLRPRARSCGNGSRTRREPRSAWRRMARDQDGPEFNTVLRWSAVSRRWVWRSAARSYADRLASSALADAGLYAYNHNLDTSPEYYEKIITTRSYQDRLQTLKSVRQAGITVCCGGIIGMGESDEDRIGLLHQLSIQKPHPESVPINVLVQVEGTPLTPSDPLDPFVLVRMIATARILMPESRVRLSAGRRSLNRECVTLCFMAGANSIFVGEKLLTTPNPQRSEDDQLLEDLDLIPLSNG